MQTWADGMPLLPGQIVHDGGLPGPSPVTEVTNEGFRAGGLFFAREDPSFGRSNLHDWYRRTPAEPLQCRNCDLYYADPRAVQSCRPDDPLCTCTLACIPEPAVRCKERESCQ